MLEDPTIQSEIFRAEYDPVRRIFVVEAAGVETFGVWQVLPDGKRKFLPDVID